MTRTVLLWDGEWCVVCDSRALRHVFVCGDVTTLQCPEGRFCDVDVQIIPCLVPQHQQGHGSEFRNSDPCVSSRGVELCDYDDDNSGRVEGVFTLPHTHNHNQSLSHNHNHNTVNNKCKGEIPVLLFHSDTTDQSSPTTATTATRGRIFSFFHTHDGDRTPKGSLATCMVPASPSSTSSTNSTNSNPITSPRSRFAPRLSFSFSSPPSILASSQQKLRKSFATSSNHIEATSLTRPNSESVSTGSTSSATLSHSVTTSTCSTTSSSEQMLNDADGIGCVDLEGLLFKGSQFNHNEYTLLCEVMAKWQPTSACSFFRPPQPAPSQLQREHPHPHHQLEDVSIDCSVSDTSRASTKLAVLEGTFEADSLSHLASQADLSQLDHLPAAEREIFKRPLEILQHACPHTPPNQTLQTLCERRQQMKSVLEEVVMEHSRRHPCQELSQELQRAIRVLLPPFPSAPDEPSQILKVEDQVKAGTVKGLVAHLTESGASMFTVEFFLTYRTFTTSRTLIELLIERFCSASHVTHGIANITHIRVVNILKVWVDSYFADFEEDEELLAVLVAFIRFHLEPRAEMQTPVRLLRTILGRKLTGRGRTCISTRGNLVNVPASIRKETPIKSSVEACRILTFDPLEIARQLTLISSQVFRSINPIELLNKHSSRVKVMEQNSNTLCRWTIGQILKQEDPKVRNRLFGIFMEVADECLTLKNFHDTVAISGGLNLSIIRQRELTPFKTHTKFKRLSHFMSSDKNRSVMRKELETLQQPCVPFLGIFRSDLEFVNCNEDHIRDKSAPGVDLINFQKRRLAAQVIERFHRLQAMHYNLHEVEILQKALRSIQIDLAVDEMTTTK